MNETKNSTPLLISTGVLLLIMGALLMYVFMPQSVVEVSVVTEESIDPDGVVSALVEAPVEYMPPTPVAIDAIALPTPDVVGTMPVAAALAERRSNRAYSDAPVRLADLSQMLWAGIGVSDNELGLRTAPSRGEANPIGYYVVVDRVEGIEPGLYHYLPETHELELILVGDQRGVWESITGQPHPKNAAVTLLVTANMARGEGYRETTFQESGHVGQNLYLQATELGLSMLVMGGFSRADAAAYLGLDEYHHVVYLVPIGNPDE